VVFHSSTSSMNANHGWDGVGKQSPLTVLSRIKHYFTLTAYVLYINHLWKADVVCVSACLGMDRPT